MARFHFPRRSQKFPDACPGGCGAEEVQKLRVSGIDGTCHETEGSEQIGDLSGCCVSEALEVSANSKLRRHIIIGGIAGEWDVQPS